MNTVPNSPSIVQKFGAVMAGACFARTGLQNPLATCLFRTNSDRNPRELNATGLGFDCARDSVKPRQPPNSARSARARGDYSPGIGRLATAFVSPSILS